MPEDWKATEALKLVQDNSRPKLVMRIEACIRGFFRGYAERVGVRIGAKLLYGGLFRA